MRLIAANLQSFSRLDDHTAAPSTPVSVPSLDLVGASRRADGVVTAIQDTSENRTGGRRQDLQDLRCTHRASSLHSQLEIDQPAGSTFTDISWDEE
jgi:hypothetical protein